MYMTTTDGMTIERLLTLAPQFHGDGHAWALDEAALRRLDACLRPGLRTLETGAGMSTVLFAMRGCRHICITPADDEVAAIKRFCAAQGISVSKVRFIVDSSCRALPSLRERIDLALVDGGHGFPTPFVDWYFIAGLLENGGRLFVDDIQLWTGRVIVDFLGQEAEWRHAGTVGAKLAEFEKVAEGSETKEWTDQPFVRAHSRSSILSMRLQRAASLVAEGRFTEVGKRLSRLWRSAQAERQEQAQLRSGKV